MFKFFRLIRQQLLSEGKTSKYFKYAIGEIILVVIGILIALQINNWNDKRKQFNHQNNYLKLLKTEAEHNLKEIRRTTNIVTKMKQQQVEVFNLITYKQDTITEQYLSQTLFNIVANIYRFKYENSALEDLKNSGNLKNIINDSLRKTLIALEPLVTEVQSQEQAVIDYRNRILNYINKNGSLTVIIELTKNEQRLGLPLIKHSKNSNRPLLNHVEFENTLINYVGVTNNSITKQYPLIEQHFKNIIAQIDHIQQSN